MGIMNIGNLRMEKKENSFKVFLKFNISHHIMQVVNLNIFHILHPLRINLAFQNWNKWTINPIPKICSVFKIQLTNLKMVNLINKANNIWVWIKFWRIAFQAKTKLSIKLIVGLWLRMYYLLYNNFLQNKIVKWNNQFILEGDLNIITQCIIMDLLMIKVYLLYHVKRLMSKANSMIVSIQIIAMD